MAKRKPLPCTPANCGDNFPRCGKKYTYDAYKCRCDLCTAVCTEAVRRYREANREKVNERQKRYNEENREQRKRWYFENREKIAETEKRYREANREKIAETKRQYYFDNHKAMLARRAKWREANPEYNRRYAAENREAAAERGRQWALANPERYREKVRNIAHRRRAKIRGTQVVSFSREQLEQRMAYYGNRCYLKLDCCTGGFEHIDHVKPISKGGAHMLANLRPACASCNQRKKDIWPFNVAA